jgi:hypothetical protein
LQHDSRLLNFKFQSVVQELAKVKRELAEAEAANYQVEGEGYLMEVAICINIQVLVSKSKLRSSF